MQDVRLRDDGLIPRFGATAHIPIQRSFRTFQSLACFDKFGEGPGQQQEQNPTRLKRISLGQSTGGSCVQ